MTYRSFSASAEAPFRLRPDWAGWRVALAVGAFILLAVPAFPAGLFERLFHHDVQVITSTDATREGALLRPPSPADPVYYFPLIKGYHDFGVAMAGEKMPVPEETIRVIVRTLAKEGYLLATVQHRPSQLIMFTWGTLYPDVMPNPGDPDLPVGQLNYRRMLGFLGGDKLGLVPTYADDWMEPLLPGLTRFDPDADAISHLAREPLYVVALVAYEFPVTQPKHPKMLWRTKISCPAIGFLLADTVPTMLAVAEPHIGRETSRPVWVNASANFKADVRIGDAKVEEYLGPGHPPASEEKAVPAKTGSGGK